MIVFKAFLRILNKNKGMIIAYTIMLLIFGGMNMSNNSGGFEFAEEKPDVLVLNYDNGTISSNIVKYLEDKTNFIEVEDNDDARSDALFYRDVNAIFIIHEGFSDEFMQGNNPSIEFKSTGDYAATYAQMILSKYIKILNVYKDNYANQEDLVEKVNESIVNDIEVSINSKIDNSKMSRVARYYSFANYSILASLVYVICIILNSFKNKNILKRTVISSSNYKKVNRDLLFSTLLFSFIMFIIYVLFSIFLLGDSIFTFNGLLCILNMFVFIITSTTLALLIGNLLNNKEAISGIINVIALGSSFLCGAFVPLEWLPDGVIKIAHILPSYYYIRSNDIAISLETFDLESILPILINNGILLVFSILFIILTNIVTKKKSIIG